jgi:hypothetical protein
MMPARCPAPMPADFAQVFTALRAILQRHAGALTVKVDGPAHYCLEGGRHPKHGTAFPIAWVEIGKTYVSFHHMAVYARPELLKGISKELKARMQGKSCFNFTTVDEKLFAELEALTAKGFAAFRNAAFMK